VYEEITVVHVAAYEENNVTVVTFELWPR